MYIFYNVSLTLSRVFLNVSLTLSRVFLNVVRFFTPWLQKHIIYVIIYADPVMEGMNSAIMPVHITGISIQARKGMDTKYMNQDMKDIIQAHYAGERPLFHEQNLRLRNTVFDVGESPLKESSHIELFGCMFKWKYPLWYSHDIYAQNCVWFEMARAGVWYTDRILLEDCQIEAPKNFRRCDGVTLHNVSMTQAEETLWQCSHVSLEKVVATGDYFAMNCRDMTVRDFTLYGNYSFDGVQNADIRHARLLSKDAFWNSQNVTVYDSFISGEYLGWNARNLTLINCTVESLQGLCYVDHLVMKNCRMINTTLAFEYTSVEADISGHIDSVFNPTEGRIIADSIGELIVQPDRVDPAKTVIICRETDSKEATV